jgi:hypothetical protein
LCGAIVVTTATACASAPVSVPVPTFDPVAPSSTSAAPTESPDSRLPADCAQLLGADELAALFGLPLDTVLVRTVQGTPSPSVGRRERLTCTYTVGPAAPSPQGVVLRLTAGAFDDTAAARAQHERNVAVERAGTSGSATPALGTAAATLLERKAGTVLLTASDVVTLDLDVPNRPRPLPSADLLVDLARRVLERLAPSSPPVGSD